MFSARYYYNTHKIKYQGLGLYYVLRRRDTTPHHPQKVDEPICTRSSLNLTHVTSMVLIGT